jgi:hypothetical protein
MEFFLPGVLLFLVAIIIVIYALPKAGPLITAILAIVFLLYGVNDHYNMFAAEYRLSTWQDGLKIYAPAIMIIFTILYVIYAILSFFTTGNVPVPSVPDVLVPSPNSTTGSIINSIGNAANSIKNKANNFISNNNSNRNNGSLFGNFGNNSRRNNNVSRSFVETF